MKTLLFNEEELNLLKNILQKDIEEQKKQLEEVNDICFEIWLADTEIILNKVNKALHC